MSVPWENGLGHGEEVRLGPGEEERLGHGEEECLGPGEEERLSPGEEERLGEENRIGGPGEEEQLSETELETGLVHARDRRRARSLPAYPEQTAVLLRALSHGCNRRVRFADALGLNLASVKHFSAAEEPRVPLHPSGLPPVPVPGAHGDAGQLEDHARRSGLALERVTVGCGRVHGTIRVYAEARAVEVGVRYTLDEWQSFVDARAFPVSVPASVACEGKRYSFTVCAPPRPEPAAAVHFALYLRGEDGELWDNNEGKNYTLMTGHLNHA